MILADRSVTVRLSANVKPFIVAMAQAEAAAKKLRDGLGDSYEPFEKETQKQKQRAPRQAAEVAGAFVRGFIRHVEAAAKQLPKLELSADSSDAQIKLATLRQALVGLSGKTIGVDIDAGVALGELRTVQMELERLSTSASEIDIRADAGAALAQLAIVQREVDRLGGETARVEVDADTAGVLSKLAATEAELARMSGRDARVGVDADVSGALSGIAMVGAALASLPAMTTIGVGAVGLGAAFAAAGTGAAGFAAVAVPGLARVNEALQETTRAAGGGGAGGAMKTAAQKAAEAASAALRLAEAQDRVKDAADRVKDAQAGVKDALQSVARAKAEAAQVSERSAAQQVAAAQRIGDAERSVADAHRASQRAVEDLTRARARAQERLEDLALATEQGALSEERAQLSIKRAQQDLARVNADPKASQLDKDDAALRLKEAEFALKSLRESNADLAAERADADRKGVEGSDEVRAAKEAVAAATRAEQDAERSLADARSAAAQAAADGQRQVAAANERVAEAQRKVADSQKDVIKAQRDATRAAQRLKVEQLQAKAAIEQAGAAAGGGGGGAASKMAELSKAERALAKDVKAFSDEYLKWQRELQPDVFPAISQGMDLILVGLDKIGPGVGGAGRALTGLGKDAEKALRGPFWASFFADVNSEIPNAITRLGHTGGNVFEGFAGVIQALLPYGRDLLGNVEDISEKFATWGTGLGTDSNFHQFMAYVQANGPAIWETLKNVAETGGNVVEALAPFGIGALGGLSLLAKLTAGMDPSHIQGIAIAVAAVYGAVKTGQTISASMEALGVLRSRLDGTGTAAGSAKTKLGTMAASLAAGGPWGLAIGAGIGALGLFASSHFEAEQRVGDLTQAIKADSGALGENTRAKVANTLQTSGAMEIARKYGISMRDLTDAALGNQGALAQVNTQLANQGSQTLGLRPAVRSLSDANKVLTGDTLELWKQLNSTNSEVGQARQAAQNLAEAMGPAATKAGDLATAQGSLSGKTIEARDAFLKQLPKLMELAGGNQKAKDEVLKLAEAYGISAKDAEKAAKGGKDLRDVLAELKSKEIRITVKTEFQDDLSREALRQASKRAEGGIYNTAGRQHMADGGIRSAGSSPQAMIARSPYMISGRNGPDVVFGEAGVEAYIPLSVGKRARGLRILQEAAGIMGMSVVPEQIAVNTAGSRMTGASGGRPGETSVTVTGIDALRSSIDTTALDLTSGLGSATDSLYATLGNAGSLTTSLGGVGAVAEQLAGEVTGWGEVISAEVPPLTSAVEALGEAVSAAASAAGGDAKGDSGSKGDEQNPRSAKGKASSKSKGKAGSKTPKPSGTSAAALAGMDAAMAKKQKAKAAAEKPIGISGAASGSAGVALSGGGGTNWSRVSKPVQSSSSGSSGASSSSGGGGGGGETTGGSQRAGGSLVQVGTLQVREQADIDQVAAALYARLGSKGR